jgi:hypothetical protein
VQLWERKALIWSRRSTRMLTLIACLQAEQIKLVKQAWADTVARMRELKPALEQLERELTEEKELLGERVVAILATVAP